MTIGWIGMIQAMDCGDDQGPHIASKTLVRLIFRVGIQYDTMGFSVISNQLSEKGWIVWFIGYLSPD